MRGMILAAGRGARMGDLTSHTAKPLLRVAGRCLIEYAIESLVRANICEIVINISWCAEQIKNQLGDGSNYGAEFVYSFEPIALETAGGIVQALPLLGPEPFAVMSSDIITDYPIDQLKKSLKSQAHLVLVNNPDFKLVGDFSLKNKQIVVEKNNPFTFASFGIYHPDFFAECVPGKLLLGDILRKKINEQQVTGEVYFGKWFNVGTPEILQEVSAF